MMGTDIFSILLGASLYFLVVFGESIKSKYRRFPSRLILYAAYIGLLLIPSLIGKSVFWALAGFVVVQTVYAHISKRPAGKGILYNMNYVIIALGALLGILYNMQEEVAIAYLFGVAIGILAPLALASALMVVPLVPYPPFMIADIILLAISVVLLTTIVSSVSVGLGLGSVFLVVISFMSSASDFFGNLMNAVIISPVRKGAKSGIGFLKSLYEKRKRKK